MSLLTYSFLFSLMPTHWFLDDDDFTFFSFWPDGNAGYFDIQEKKSNTKTRLIKTFHTC